MELAGLDPATARVRCGEADRRASTVACDAEPDHSTAIVGGSPTDNCRYPWMLADLGTEIALVPNELVRIQPPTTRRFSR